MRSLKIITGLAIAYAVVTGIILAWLLVVSSTVVVFYELPVQLHYGLWLTVFALPVLVVGVIWLRFDVDTEFNANLRQIGPTLPVLIATYVVITNNPFLLEDYMAYVVIGIFLLAMLLIRQLPKEHPQLKGLLYGYLGLPLADIIGMTLQLRNQGMSAERLIVTQLTVFSLSAVLLSGITYLLKQHYIPVRYLQGSDEVLYVNKQAD